MPTIASHSPLNISETVILEIGGGGQYIKTAGSLITRWSAVRQYGWLP